GEDRRRAEDERLLSVQRGGERRPDRDLGLAEPDVAADEPVHRPRRLEVLLHGLDRLLLIVRLPVRKRRFEALEPVPADVEREAGCLLPPRVERQEHSRELADGGARPALEVLPGLASELRERGSLRVRTDVARDLRQLLVRDVEAVFSPEGEEEVVAG